ncbi:MAG: 30S ribosomal protein S6 [Candidatus Omnitrophica bacterium]|nr:30S ribosomal protein S6 [Candidatus Omnitrophota bacterium]MCM8777231.1 30S ribosomal protein S6 [Candidatus Omnitrophota bacterium]
MERKYEGCFLLRADLEDEVREKEISFIEGQISDNGGQIVKREVWGKKYLAYPIKKEREAFYYIVYFKTLSDSLSSISEGLRRRENIIRYLFLQRRRFPELEKDEQKGERADARSNT